MVEFTTVIRKFDSKGEKTGWTYIEVPQEFANEILPGTKTSFLVKGKLDATPFAGLSLLPMGGGDFILSLNADLRKKLRKAEGAMLFVQIEADKQLYELNQELMNCLQDSPDALLAFNKLPASHQKYYSKWIDSAKTEPTKAKRIALTIEAMVKNLSYAEMLRKNRESRF